MTSRRSRNDRFMDVVGIFAQASSLVCFVYLVVSIAATGGTWMQVVLVFVFLGASLGIGFAREGARQRTQAAQPQAAQAATDAQVATEPPTGQSRSVK